MYEEASMPIEEVIEKYRAGTEEKREKRGSASSECSAASSSSGYASSSSSAGGNTDKNEAEEKDIEKESLNGVSHKGTTTKLINKTQRFCFAFVFDIHLFCFHFSLNVDNFFVCKRNRNRDVERNYLHAYLHSILL